MRTEGEQEYPDGWSKQSKDLSDQAGAPATAYPSSPGYTSGH